MKQQGAIRDNSTGIRRVVVVGGGPAAHRFTESMHARGLAGWHITVLTEEAHAPYDRVALSRALTEVDTDLTLGDPTLWAHASVELVRGAEVAAICPDTKTVQIIADGELAHYPYDELVLATGSDAVRLGLPGAEHLHVYRTLEDVRALNAEVALLGQKLGRTVNTAVIGGGLLGLEAAAGLIKLGAASVVINGGPWLMNAQLDEGAGQALAAWSRPRA